MTEPHTLTAALIDGLIGGFLAGVLLTILGLHALMYFGPGEPAVYSFPATIGNGSYTMEIEVESTIPIDATTQHAIIFDAQLANK